MQSFCKIWFFQMNPNKICIFLKKFLKSPPFTVLFPTSTTFVCPREPAIGNLSEKCVVLPHTYAMPQLECGQHIHKRKRRVAAANQLNELTNKHSHPLHTTTNKMARAMHILLCWCCYFNFDVCQNMSKKFNSICYQ